jgi:hypothetical protein
MSLINLKINLTIPGKCLLDRFQHNPKSTDFLSKTVPNVQNWHDPMGCSSRLDMPDRFVKEHLIGAMAGSRFFRDRVEIWERKALSM